MLKRRLCILFALFILSMAVITPLAAQEATPAEEQPVAGAVESTGNAEVATGAGTLMLVIGVGAVVAVGGAMILRGSFRSRQEQAQ